MPSPSEILQEAAQTYHDRNMIYKDNYKKVGEIMHCLFPDGIPDSSVEGYNVWHLFELMIVKITRFANTELKHTDSMRDVAVYAAMIESIINETE